MHWFMNWINIIFHQSLVSYDFKKMFFIFQSFARNKSYLDHAKSSPNLTILAGGKCDDR